jgi:hypothetical protein
MTQSKKLEKNQTIEFRITEIKKISYFQNDFSVYGLVKSDISKGEVSLSINFQLVEEVESVAVYVNTNFSVNKDEKRIELFGIETIHTFAIRNIKNKFYDEKYKNYDIPYFINVFEHVCLWNPRYACGFVFKSCLLKYHSSYY